MTESSSSPIFAKTESLLRWLLEHTRKFPRHEQPRLARRIEDAAFAFHACLLRAVQPAQKHDGLLAADIELNKLRAYLRLSMECGYTSHNQYGYAAQELTEVGKLLGGWMKKT